MLLEILGKIDYMRSYTSSPRHFCSQMILQNVDKAQVRLLTKRDNVAGVTLPIFETAITGTNSKSVICIWYFVP